MLINRVEELALLENVYKKKKPSLLLVYGRRRVGKTSLLVEFSKKHNVLYLLARQESMSDQLKKISIEISTFFQDAVLKNNPFQNYDALFLYILEKKIPVIFDEFPFLVESQSALPSILQEYWDKYFSKSSSFIILCGSSIRMMESLLGYKSPLYGRRTGQVLLSPFSFKDTCLFFPKISSEKKVETYSVLGGTPAYILEFDPTKTIRENIKEKILQKNTFLSQDVEFVLKEELNEPRIYYSILRSVANGNTTLGAIMNDTGLEKGIITKYISILQSLHMIERKVPVTEKNTEKSRRGLYFLQDNYFKFWFRFIFPNKEYIEQDRQEKLLQEKIIPEMDSYVGRIFEDVAREWIKMQDTFNKYIIGSWWEKEEEIDIVGVDTHSNSILFGEVKWSSLSTKQSIQIIEKLREKSEKVRWGINTKKEYLLIAKKIADKKTIREKGIHAYDLEDII